jgi:hypothetical protein
MRDIKDPRLIKLKGILFLVQGVLAGGVLLMIAPSWRVALLLAVTVWSFCRFYYFAFYVIQHYVDPSFRFAGLGSFIRYMIGRK